MRLGLLSIHFTSQEEYANIEGGKEQKRGNWIKDSVRQDADYETGKEKGMWRESARGFLAKQAEKR